MIAADLEAKIKSGRYRPGEALPAQRALSIDYGVTLMTLRQGLQVLIDDGLITQHAGRGTFVAAPKASYNLGSLRSLADDLREQGHTVHTELLGRERRRPPDQVADQLGPDDRRAALRIERLRRLADAPAIHQESWLPVRFSLPFGPVDFAETSLYGALAEQGVVVTRADERLRPGILDERLAERLEQPPGTPVFLSDRVTYGIDDTVVVVDRATILGEFVEVRTTRVESSLSMHWTGTGSANPVDPAAASVPSIGH